MRGLRGRPALAPHHALLIPNATSVHTFGMDAPITVAWLDDALRVLEIRHLPPSRITLPRRRARHVLECAEHAELRPGDRLRLVASHREGGPRPGAIL